MGELSAESLADWLHPSDVLDYYHQRGDLNPKALVTSMLRDGKLRAGADQLVINGLDHGVALIPREAWNFAAGTDVWSTGQFRLMHIGNDGDISISAYDVRVDPDVQELPKPTVRPPKRIASATPKQPLSENRLSEWSSMFFAENPGATETEARHALEASFPAKFVSRERLRRIMPPRGRGRPLKDQH